MSPALNGSTAIQHSEHGNAVEIRYGICRVKVKIMDKFVDAVVERTHFISKLSFDCRVEIEHYYYYYYYMTHTNE